jgi:hypothetical protein
MDRLELSDSIGIVSPSVHQAQARLRASCIATTSAVYPQGYVPLHANPVDDILAKVTIKVVIDGGTSRQETYTFSPTDEDVFRTDLTIHDINAANPDLPGFIVIPRMAPLSLGHHTYQLWVLTAQHMRRTQHRGSRKLLPRWRARPVSANRLTSRSPSPVAAS